jgi:hypothetical protein
MYLPEEIKVTSLDELWPKREKMSRKGIALKMPDSCFLE